MIKNLYIEKRKRIRILKVLGKERVNKKSIYFLCHVLIKERENDTYKLEKMIVLRAESLYWKQTTKSFNILPKTTKLDPLKDKLYFESKNSCVYV